MLVTALRITDVDGAEALSMPRMVEALDRDPMPLHRFMPSEDELLDGVVGLVLAEFRPLATPLAPARNPCARWRGCSSSSSRWVSTRGVRCALVPSNSSFR